MDVADVSDVDGPNLLLKTFSFVVGLTIVYEQYLPLPACVLVTRGRSYAVVTYVTAKAPGCGLHGRAMTGNGLRVVALGAGRVVDEDIANRPTDTLLVEVVVDEALVFD